MEAVHTPTNFPCPKTGMTRFAFGRTRFLDKESCQCFAVLASK
jgi:hypothetical protein